MSLYSMIVMMSRLLGQLTEYHLHQPLFFISYNLHQLQLPHPASSSLLPFAIDAKGGEMFRGRDVLVRGSSPWGGACCQLSTMKKGEIVGQSEPCMVCLSLMFVIDVNWVFDWGLVLGLGPLWNPSCVLFCVLSGRPFPHIQAQVWSHLESFEMSQKPLWVGVWVLWACVWVSLYLLFLPLNWPS